MAELLGRELEVEQVRAVLRAGDVAVLVVGGPLGVGKSKLLRTACEEEGWRLAPELGEPGLYIDARDDRASAAAKVLVALGADPDCDVVDTLEAQAPIVLAFDRYRAADDVDRWLDRKVLGRLRGREAAVVFAASDTNDDADLLADPALWLRLGPLPAEPVRAFLRERADELDLTIGDDELERYVEAIRGDPALVRPFERLFELEASTVPRR